MTQPILVLDPVTASRIAAGEVVERPASVVKELLENSLDAGADEVEVTIQEGGRRLIRVNDNGRGIPGEQVEMAIARHATSKIRDASDLTHVATLGFRGEALASIASVSRLTLTTRTPDADAATRIVVHNGAVVDRGGVAAPVGTSVVVEHLFNSVPARLKFLKTDTTEAGHVSDLVTRYALANPSHRLSLTKDGRSVFKSLGTGDLQDVLVAAFGLDVARELVAIPATEVDGAQSNVSDDDVTVRGFVSPPHIHRATRKYMTLFVNGRWVQESQLSYAVMQAYHTLLPKGRFPISVVAVTVPVEAVDVNVHPAKTQVRFRDGRPVFRAVSRAVRMAVLGQAPVAPLRDAPPPPDHWQVTRRGSSTGPQVAEHFDQSGFADAGDSEVPMLRVVGQVAQAFVVAEGPEGLYLIDQHAAHERVMYEAFMAQGWKGASQQLLAPETVVLSDVHLGLVSEHLDTFKAVGYDIEPFGRDTVVVRAVPDVLATGDIAGALVTVLDLVAAGGSPIEEAYEERLVRAVCKQATVKAGQTLSMDEMRSLVLQLEGTASPRTCPHGRPTMIVLSHQRLEREFGRT